MKSLIVNNARPDQLVIEAPPSDVAAFVAKARAGGIDVRQSAGCTCGGNHSQSSVSNKKPIPLGIPHMTFNKSETAKAEVEAKQQPANVTNKKRGLGIPVMRF
jgi:hypothetical protein